MYVCYVSCSCSLLVATGQQWRKSWTHSSSCSTWHWAWLVSQQWSCSSSPSWESGSLETGISTSMCTLYFVGIIVHVHYVHAVYVHVHAYIYKVGRFSNGVISCHRLHFYCIGVSLYMYMYVYSACIHVHACKVGRFTLVTVLLFATGYTFRSMCTQTLTLSSLHSFLCSRYCTVNCAVILYLLYIVHCMIWIKYVHVQ